jgi:hypothetical protein
MVGSNRKAEMNVVNVKPQSRRNRGVKRGASSADAAEVAVVITGLLERGFRCQVSGHEDLGPLVD